MSKVMLVEDDNNLREIYEARLQAEGYTIVTAHDGEEALVVAKAEQPDLIISDVMMPKISGFEMLDILRNTDGMKDVKVIMLTALGQSDDQQRADRLGADSYLVKSQVTLEDIVKVAARLLGTEEEVVPPVLEQAVAPVVAPPDTAPAAVPSPITPAAPAPQPIEIHTPEPIQEPAVQAIPDPVTPIAVMPAAVPAPITEASALNAIPDPTNQTLASLEIAVMEASARSTTPGQEPPAAAQAVQAEAASVDAQIANFANDQSTTAPLVVAPVPEPVGPASPEQYVSTPPPDLTTTAPVTPPGPASAGNDDVLATALQSLTGEAPAPAPAAAEAVSVTAAAPSDDPTVATRGGNRIIAPLGSTPKPDLNTLLAMEEAKESALATPPVPLSPPVPTTPPAAPNAVVPATAPAAIPVAPAPGTVDPNSIAL